MASDINRVCLTGNITRDPEIRATMSGTQVLHFGIASNASRKNGQTGQWEEYPNFIDCTMFGARAEALSRILAKGMKVAITGELRYSSWERDGQHRSKLEVVADQVVLMQRRGNDHQTSQNQEYGDSSAQPGGNTEPDTFAYDLPF